MFDPLASTTSMMSMNSMMTVDSSTPSTMMAARKPPPSANSSIIAYTFGPGPMGITLEDAQGGTRVVINEVLPSSQAFRLGVPVGGVLMQVNGRIATGRRKVHIGKWLAAADRPVTLQIMHPGGAAAAIASLAAAVELIEDDEFAVPVGRGLLPAQPNVPMGSATETRSPSSLGEVMPYTFGSGSLGIAFNDTPNGAVISAVSGAAEAQGVPVGGTLLQVNAESVIGQSKASVTNMLAKTSRPLELLIRSVSALGEAAAASETASWPRGGDSSAAAPSPSVKASSGALERERSKSSRGSSTSRNSSASRGGATSRGGDGSGTTRRQKKHKKGKSTSRTPRAEKDRKEPKERPPSFKYTFGPGPLGLGLDDARGGGVIVSEVVAGSAAAEQGVRPGGLVMQLNGMDVLNQGKVGLSKMIGYIPRPLIVMLSPPLPTEAELASQVAQTADAQVASAPVAAPAAAAAATARPKPKSALKTAKASRQRRPSLPISSDDVKATAKAVVLAEDAPVRTSGNADAIVSETASAVIAAWSAKTKSDRYEEGDTPEGDNEMERQVEEQEEDEVYEFEGNGQVDPETPITPDETGIGASSTDQPTGAEAPVDANTSSHLEASSAPAEPKRAHPPPLAPVDAWPPWATTPPPRSPRVVVGGDAKYALKATREAFSHASLAGP